MVHPVFTVLAGTEDTQRDMKQLKIVTLAPTRLCD